MSREIKARAYCPRRKQMMQLQFVDLVNQRYKFLEVDDGWIEGENGAWPECPPLWFTGLKDKNGKEIYQDDIISDHVGIGVVEYVDDAAAFRVNYRDGKAKWFIDYSLKGEKESIEVIGNIHESPDLLESA